MGANVLGERKTRAIAEAIGLPVVWAVVWSHVESGRYVAITTADHQHGTYDRRSGGYRIDQGACRQTSCEHLFKGSPTPGEVLARSQRMRRGEAS